MSVPLGKFHYDSIRWALSKLQEEGILEEYLQVALDNIIMDTFSPIQDSESNIRVSEIKDMCFLKEGIYLKTENGFEEAVIYMSEDDAKYFDIGTSIHICRKEDFPNNTRNR